MRIRIFLLFFALVGLYPYFSVYVIADSDQCPTITTERDVPKEIASAAQGIIVFDRQSGLYRTLQIGETPPVILVPPQTRSDDFTIAQIPVLSDDGTQILSVYNNTSGQTLLVLNKIATLSESTEIIVDNLQGYISWLNANTVIATSEDLGNQVYSYKKISTLSGEVENIDIQLNDQLPMSLQARVSPDESRLAYIRYSTTKSNRLVDELMIMDNNIGVKIKALTASTIDSIYRILWSPLGSYVLVTVIERGTTLFQIFDKNAHFVTSIKVQRDLEVPVQWSPDEKYVLYNELIPQNDSHPTFFNVQSSETRNFCLDGEGFWSPDSRYLGMVEYATQKEGIPRQVAGILVYDTTENRLYRLGTPNLEDIGSVLGWGAGLR